MPSEVYLVNRTAKEYIAFYGLPASKGNEVIKNRACSSIVTKYLLENMGNEISFINSGWGEWPFEKGALSDLKGYSEVTEKYLVFLQNSGVLNFKTTTDDEGVLLYEVTFI